MSRFRARKSYEYSSRPASSSSTAIGAAMKYRTEMGSGSRYGRSTYLSSMRPAVLLLARTCIIPLASAAPFPLRWTSQDGLTVTAETPEIDEPDLFVYLGVAMALVLLGGAFAGLTIALMGQDETYLQVIATSGEGSEREHAERVLNLLKKGKHWVLVTLLLSNVITNETLPIVLDRFLGAGWTAVLGSTVLIVIFGEIAPQSVCVRYGLSIGAYCSPFVLVLMWIMCPVAWPTAKLLDWLLGEDHGTMYKKAGLKTLVQLHNTLGTTGERLMEDEVTIINSVLDLKEKPVGDIMTPMQDVFTMSADTVLDERMMDIILSQGYSRIPIYLPDNNKNFIGMLLVKILITYDPEDAKRVRDFALATLPETAPHTSCLDIINFFQEGKSHMVLVSDFPGQDKGALGVVTLEDVIEELIGEEIIDESDVFIDVHKAIRRLAPAPRQRFTRVMSQDALSAISSDHEGEGEDDLLLAPPLSRKNSGSRKGSGTVRQSNGPLPTTFMLRKGSVASDTSRGGSRPAGLLIRSDGSEIREQLKFLGPSNAASKPKPTKFTNVKIKPGNGTIHDPKGVADPVERAKSMDIDLGQNTADRNETNPLVRSAGKDASDGTAALHISYGTLETPHRLRRAQSGSNMSASEASQLAERKATSPTNSRRPNSKEGCALEHDHSQNIQIPGKMIVGNNGELENSEDVRDPGAPSWNRSGFRRTAMSGSITETTVDFGGMNKLVLETTSSSEDMGETALSTGSPGSGGSPSREKDMFDSDEYSKNDQHDSRNASSSRRRGRKKHNEKG